MLNKAIILVAALAAQSAGAIDQRIGDWFVSKNEAGYPFAATINEAGSGLMHLCNTDTKLCYWYVVMDSTCEPGTESPALFNSASGGSFHTMKCDKDVAVQGRKLYRLSIDNYSAIDTHAEQVGVLGVAFPLESGQFRVLRFSLTGSARAISAMLETARKASPSSKRASDTIL